MQRQNLVTISLAFIISAHIDMETGYITRAERFHYRQLFNVTGCEVKCSPPCKIYLTGVIDDREWDSTGFKIHRKGAKGPFF
jgi:hypothetical protein